MVFFQLPCIFSYARNIGPRILEFFESFYNIDYPLPKQDMAAIPDFASGLFPPFKIDQLSGDDLIVLIFVLSQQEQWRTGA